MPPSLSSCDNRTGQGSGRALVVCPRRLALAAGGGTRGGAYGDAGAAVAGAGRPPGSAVRCRGGPCAAPGRVARRRRRGPPRAGRCGPARSPRAWPARSRRPAAPATTGSPCRQRVMPRNGRAGHGVPTHSSCRRLNTWCFQIGTSALSWSIRAREASNASSRCAADDGDDDRRVADGERSDPVHRGQRRGRRTRRRRRRRPPAAGRARSGARSTPARSRRGRRRGRGPGRRTGSARPTASSSSAASTSSTSSGVSRSRDQADGGGLGHGQGA